MRKVLSALAAFLVLAASFATPALAQSSIPVAMGPGLSTLTDGQATSLRTDLFGRLYVNVHNIASVTPTTGTVNANGTNVSTAALASNLVVSSAATSLLYMQVTSGASAGFVMVFNATSAPADGAVTPVFCYALAANSTLTQTYNAIAQPFFSTGVTVVFSTTGCFSKTASATAFIAAVKG